MVKVPTRQTTYASYLYSKAEELCKREGGFTITRLSEFTGLKPTGNMRRRIQHSVEAGTLVLEVVPAGENGSQNLYSLPQPKFNGDIPF